MNAQHDFFYQIGTYGFVEFPPFEVLLLFDDADLVVFGSMIVGLSVALDSSDLPV